MSTRRTSITSFSSSISRCSSNQRHLLLIKHRKTKITNRSLLTIIRWLLLRRRMEVALGIFTISRVISKFLFRERALNKLSSHQREGILEEMVKLLIIAIIHRWLDKALMKTKLINHRKSWRMKDTSVSQQAQFHQSTNKISNSSYRTLD